jgi:nitronate monooxygenase
VEFAQDPPALAKLPVCHMTHFGMTFVLFLPESLSVGITLEDSQQIRHKSHRGKSEVKMQLPIIIQGGMGVAISNWHLARAVSLTGQLGVVSGTGLSRVLISRLMDGDPSGDMRRALAAFPAQAVAQKIIDRYYVPGGKAANVPYKSTPVYSLNPPKSLDALTVAANFVEVFLAKEGHSGIVGINLLEKLQMPTMASLYGALLAQVDYVLMGAGIPIQIAGLLDKLSRHEACTYRLDVVGAAADDDFHIAFDPQSLFPGLAEQLGRLKRPHFLPIISSFVLAQALLKRSEGAINGFVIEGPVAGGHNAPPRGPLKLNERGEPIYTEKDTVDLEKMQTLGLPFWLAGGYASPQELRSALAAGAAGVQVGTAFALCNESGMESGLKQRLLEQVLAEEAEVFTSPTASPTGFPFKIAQLEGTLSDHALYEKRGRICDMGFLRTLYKQPDGSLGYRCPAEPVDDYVRKGGALEDTVNRTCLCNNLAATAGFPQYREAYGPELPVVTAGDDLVNCGRFVRAGTRNYSAETVVHDILKV